MLTQESKLAFIFHKKDLTISEKMVLLSIAFNASESNKSCCLSIKELSEFCSCSGRTVQKALIKLSDLHLIRKEPMFYLDGGRAANQYFIVERSFI